MISKKGSLQDVLAATRYIFGYYIIWKKYRNFLTSQPRNKPFKTSYSLYM